MNENSDNNNTNNNQQNKQTIDAEPAQNQQQQQTVNNQLNESSSPYEGDNKSESQKSKNAKDQNNIQQADNRRHHNHDILSQSSSDDDSHMKQKHQKQQQQQQKDSNEEKKKQMPKKMRYKYCCKICKHTDPNKKACVCVVPKGQRRTEIGCHGCQTCGCNGCSKEDFVSRGQDPQYHPGDKKKARRQGVQFQARNGCCRNCMKAFSKTNKSCLCQVPQSVRNTKLPSSGCKICGCFGCNPQDKKQSKNKRSRATKQRSRSRDKKKKHRTQKRDRSSSENSRQYIDSSTMNFNNIDKSVIGTMMVNEYRLDPALLGFGIPQRTFSYLTGKPKR